MNRLIGRFQQFSPDLLIISNNPAAYQELGLPVFSDIYPGRGALGGLLTALSVAATPLVGLIAVDMPFASPHLINILADQLQQSDWDGIIPSTVNGLEPLHAVYRREVCLTYVKEAIDQDLWRMKAWHNKANLKVLDPEEVLEITDTAFTFLNLNTLQEFDEAEKLALKLGLE